MFEETITRVAPHTTAIDDETLVRQVYQALNDIEPLRVLRSPVRVQANKGVVTLSGVVATYPIKARALQTVRSLAGVQQVRDELWTDSDVELEVAHALSVDPRTHQVAFDIIVNAINGQVSLVGQVSSAAIAQTAETIAASVAGVRTVSNRLQLGSKT
jgi:osmotically-inducible protein OsmY